MSLSLAIGLSAASSGLPGEPPVPVVPSILNVSVVGVPHVGNTLTAMALISGFPYPALTYTWRDQDSNVLQSSASSQLSVTGAQLGLDLSVEVNAVNSEGSGSTTSAPVGPVIGAAIAPTVLTASGISGDAGVGGMLTGVPATFEGTAPIEINYGWHESPNGISDWVATGNTTTTGPVMVEGMYYMFGTSGRNDAGEVTSYSAAISPAVMTSLSVVATPTGQTTAQLDISGTAVGRDVYWFVSTSATPPAVADLKAGTGAASSGTYVALDVPQAVDGPSGLTPSTTYYVHVVSTMGGQDSDVVTSASFATFVLDTTAPILSSATATALGSTSLSGSVTTDDGDGLIYFVVTTTSNSVNAAQIEAGYDHTNSPAIAAYSQAVLDVGTQDIAASIEGLTDGQTYYLHFSQRDDTGNSSVSITSAGVTLANTTPPELSSLEATAEPDDATSATAQFNIDVPATVYVATVLQGAAVPTEAQMESGTHGVHATSVVVAGHGHYSAAITGLSETTSYQTYFMARDDGGNRSSIGAAVMPFETISASVIAEYFLDGTASGATVYRSTIAQAQADSDSGTNAVLWSNDGTGSGNQSILMLTPGNGVTFNDGENVIRGSFKTIAAPGKLWLRIRAQDASNADRLNIDITDDATPDANRIGAVSNWTSVSVTTDGNGWAHFEGTLNMAGGGDLVGRLNINMATQNKGSSVLNTTPNEFQVAVHNLTVATE